jgi:tRNA dimethylallyltransferase
MISYKGKIIVIAGPSASGKSDIAIALAKEIGGYIINADSRQIYKHLNIGTAKPAFQKSIEKNIYIIDDIKHYLFDFVDPKQNYTLFDYQKDVDRVLQKEKAIPILVGGTGLYIDSIVFNYNLTKNTYNNNLQTKSIKELQNLAKPYIHQMTLSDSKNRHRLIRAIQRGGVDKLKGQDLNNIYFVIDIPKDTLTERVKKRIEIMFKNGLLQENKSLLERGYTYKNNGMNSIGYIEFKEYFNGRKTLKEVKKNILKNTIKYIKRQRTWFKRNNNCIWLNNFHNVLEKTRTFLEENKKGIIDSR